MVNPIRDKGIFTMASARHLNFDLDFFSEYYMCTVFKNNYLDRGASGFVFGPFEKNGKQLALKQTVFANGKVTEEFKKDLDIKKTMWISLEHKNLLSVHSVDLSLLPRVMFIVMEYAAGGSLNKILRSLGSEQKLPIEVVTVWAKQIAEGMKYLHEKKIVHRDLKSSNVLLMDVFDVRNPRKPVTLKITDFDEAKELHHTTTMSFVGTCAYMAPEVLLHQMFSKGSDVWSFGVLIWEMLSGDIPHKGLDPSTIIHRTANGELKDLSFDQSFSEEYESTLKSCWKLQWKERPTFHQLFCSLQEMERQYMRTEIATGGDEDNVTAQQLRDLSAKIFNSMRRLHGFRSRERMRQEDKIDMLSTDFPNGKVKRNDDVQNTYFMETRYRLKRDECVETRPQQLLRTPVQDKLEKAAYKFEETNTKVSSLATETEQMKETIERRRKEREEYWNNPKAYQAQTQKNYPNLPRKLKVGEDFEDNYYVEEESQLESENTVKLKLHKHEKATVEEKAQYTYSFFKLPDKLRIHVHRQSTENIFGYGTSRLGLEQRERKVDPGENVFFTKEAHADRISHQTEDKINSPHLSEFPHKKEYMCVTNEGRDHVKRQPFIEDLYRFDVIHGWQRVELPQLKQDIHEIAPICLSKIEMNCTDEEGEDTAETLAHRSILQRLWCVRAQLNSLRRNPQFKQDTDKEVLKCFCQIGINCTHKVCRKGEDKHLKDETMGLDSSGEGMDNEDCGRCPTVTDESKVIFAVHRKHKLNKY